MTSYLPMFKVWDTRYKMMIGIQDILDLDYKHQDVVAREKYTGKIWRLPFHQVEILAFTGQKDSQGREVYLGDVLKWSPSETEAQDGLKEVYAEVVYHDFKYRHQNAEGGLADKIFLETDAVVVGNVYENPELKELVRKREE